MGIFDQQSPGILGKISGWMNPERASAFQALGMGLSQLGAGQPVDLSPAYDALRARQQRAEAQKALEGSGVMERFTPEQRAVLAQMEPGAAQKIIAYSLFNKPEPVKPITVNNQLVNPETGEVIGDYRTQQGAGGTEYGLNPQYGVDAEGNPVLIQIGKDGTATETRLPDGVTFQKEPIRIDAGTEWVLLDPITRNPVGRVPKNQEEAAAAQARGTETGRREAERVADAPNTIAQAQDGMALIDSIINDPALPSVVGTIQGRLPTGTPRMLGGGGQAGANVQAKIDQMAGKAFLQAFDSLKGGGQITQIEGEKATNAIARLQQTQDEEAFKQSLLDIRWAMERAMRRAQGEDLPDTPRVPDAGGFPDVSGMNAAQIQDLMDSRPISEWSDGQKKAVAARLRAIKNDG